MKDLLTISLDGLVSRPSQAGGAGLMYPHERILTRAVTIHIPVVGLQEVVQYGGLDWTASIDTRPDLIGVPSKA